VLAMGWVLASVPVRAQVEALHATGPLPSFEVATIKPDRSANRRATPNEQFLNAERIEMLIWLAYNLPPEAHDRIVGGPDWVRKDKYSIEMKIEDSVVETLQKMSTSKREEQIHLMEQSLLADRFKLKVHFEMREMPIYELIAGKGGAKLPPAKFPNPIGSLQPVERVEDIQRGIVIPINGGPVPTITLKGYTLQDLASFLAVDPEIGRTVVDLTKITGSFDIPLTMTFGYHGSPDGVSAFTALQELGLKLVPSKGPVEVLVIDSIERPSEN